MRLLIILLASFSLTACSMIPESWKFETDFWTSEEESVATGPALARIEWNGTDGQTSEDSFLQVSKAPKSRSQMGYCGVVEPQLQLLNRVLQGGVSHWHGLMVHSNR